MSKFAGLLDTAKEAREHAYAPYSGFAVGAALQFADGAVVVGANVENASYGLSLCAEAVAVGKAMAAGKRGGLVAIAVAGPGESKVTPCGRCRQMLHELAALGGTDPVVISGGAGEGAEMALSELLPQPFGPDTLA